MHTGKAHYENFEADAHDEKARDREARFPAYQS